MDGSTKKVQVDEFVAALKAAEGVRNPTDAGIRMGNEKFMFINHNPGTKITQLSKRGGGGAALMKTVTGLIIGTWSKDDLTMSKKAQNGGDCALQVEVIGNYLIEHGY